MDIITYLTTIHFGAGALSSVGDAMRELSISRPLVVSDHGIAAAGLLDRLSREVGSDARDDREDLDRRASRRRRDQRK